MRQAVRRPAPGLKRRFKAQGSGTLSERPTTDVVPKLAYGALDIERLKHAKLVKQSSRITHFSSGAPAYAVPVTVVPAGQSALSKPTATPKKPERQPAPEADDIFERAIQHATSHLEPAPKSRKKHRLHLGRKHARA